MGQILELALGIQLQEAGSAPGTTNSMGTGSKGTVMGTDSVGGTCSISIGSCSFRGVGSVAVPGSMIGTGSMWTNSVSETSSVVGLGSVWADSKGKTVSVAGMDSVLGTGSVDAGSPAGTVEADSGSVGAD